MKIRHNPPDKIRPPKATPRKVPIIDGPFAETKELVGGCRQPDAAEE